MPTVKEIFDCCERLFFEKLKAKTNWGRNELINAWLEAKAEAAIELLEKQNDRQSIFLLGGCLYGLQKNFPQGPMQYVSQELSSRSESGCDIERRH